ncbi:MAG: peptidase S14 [Sphingobium sp.]|uniref:head maturation protease, ClpP-related n=1 Tax=Sphingobium sp. TaxID=1912891 RepID=UPI000DB20827|nr:head maturation protease, ClpP-related [Sphingobium sp.]PZU13809.1 MAG: peptidase S14 [Sphingobium sp.]
MHRKIFDLAHANQGKGAPLRAEVAGDTATIYVYDVIDAYWGVSAAEMAKTLAGITAPNIALRINSPGGDVFEARAMMAQLVAHPATITAKIDGLAASAASFLALAADTVEIAEGGFFMIHKGWTWMMGNADDFRDASNLLDKVDGSIVDTYASKSSKSADEIVAWMTDETWFSAQEAVEAGFCDQIMPTTAAGKANARAFNLGVYEKAPKALIAADEAVIDAAARDRMMARLNLYERT